MMTPMMPSNTIMMRTIMHLLVVMRRPIDCNADTHEDTSSAITKYSTRDSGSNTTSKKRHSEHQMQHAGQRYRTELSRNTEHNVREEWTEPVRYCRRSVESTPKQ